MPRPISWLPRLHTIRRTVAGSVRSHYERRDLEGLFELQPRAAQKLIELLPSATIGRSRLIQREALLHLLDGMQEADNPSAYLESVQRQKIATSRRKIRTLVQRDIEPARLATLPANLSLSRCQLQVSFRTIEELAQSLYALAQAIEADGEEMARQFEIHEEAEDGTPMRAEYDAMMAELANLEAARITPRPSPTSSRCSCDRSTDSFE